MAERTNIDLRNKVIYSIFVRNYSEQGTFKEVEKDLDRIEKLGVDIIWLLPIHPIGKKNRKGKLGSPYAIRDYRMVNAELGTVDDLRSLVDAIHSREMKCIIDVVYNHTSPDSWLAENHPEYFWHTENGEMSNRVGGWEDIVDLDYSNMELWDYQIGTLKMWAEIVDGFRCDVAPLLPLEFWRRARREVENVNPECFWLSESVEPELILDFRKKGWSCLSDAEILQIFDACYDYDIFKYFRGYISGENTLEKYAEYVNMQEYIYPANYVKLRYLENHDQARAKSMIKGHKELLNWTAFIYFQKGATLIYAGQEMENDFRPDLFDKDTVQWDTGKDISGFLANMYEIKKKIPAEGAYSLKSFNENILIGTYVSAKRKLVGIFNLADEKQEVPVDVPDGTYINMVTMQEVCVTNGRAFSDGDAVIIEVE